MEGILASIFHRFWWILGAKLGGKIEPRSKKKCMENMMQNRSRFERVLDRFWPHFGRQNKKFRSPLGHYGRSIFALNISFVFDIVFGRPKTSQDVPQTLPRRVFGRLKTSQDVPQTPPRRPKTHPRRPQDVPKTLQDAPRRLQGAPRRRLQKCFSKGLASSRRSALFSIWFFEVPRHAKKSSRCPQDASRRLFNSTQFNSIQINSTQFNSPQFSSIQ